MNRMTGLLMVFAIISVGSLVLIVTGTQGISHSQEPIDTIYTVEFAKETLLITDSIHVEILHPLLGTIVASTDGSTCWIITDVDGGFYYKILEECPNGF